MRKIISCVSLFTLVALFFTSCGHQQTAEEVKRDFKAEANAVYASCVSQDECYLCGGIGEYDGQNNVGIISLNTFQLSVTQLLLADSHNGEALLYATVSSPPQEKLFSVSLPLFPRLSGFHVQLRTTQLYSPENRTGEFRRM